MLWATISFWDFCIDVENTHLSGQATRAYCMHGFSSTQKKFCGQTDILQALCVLPKSDAKVPMRLLRVFYVACMPHPGMVDESCVLDTDNKRALRGTACEQRGKCEEVARKMRGVVDI